MARQETPPAVTLSPSERRTLQQLAEGEFHIAELDWVARQHLKRTGLAEERGAAIVITQEGRRAMRRLMTEA
ncbi:MAG: hypothetical protein ABW003_14195 [Microvirga sp.]